MVLVEDNDVFRETLELLLGLRGDLEIVASVATGQEAIDIVGKLDPDVVAEDISEARQLSAIFTAIIIKARRSPLRGGR